MRAARVLLALLVLNGAIITHELGHFGAARLLDIEVDVVSLGFGPALATWHPRPNLEARISAVPLGGYVQISKEGAKELEKRPFWQGLLVEGAGVAVNWLLPIAFLLLLSPWYRENISHPRRAQYPETIIRPDLIAKRRVKFPLLGPIYFFKALAAPISIVINEVTFVVDNLAEEYAWKFSDLSRMIGFFNLLPLFFVFDGGQMLLRVTTALFGADGVVFMAAYFTGTIAAFIAWQWIPQIYPRYWRKLL